MSGGQKQKVMLARAFVQEADYLLLDEPTSNLDMKHQVEVLEQIRHSVRQQGIGAVVAIHDLNMALRFPTTSWCSRKAPFSPTATRAKC